MRMVKLTDAQIIDLLEGFLRDLSLIAVNEIETPFRKEGIKLTTIKTTDKKAQTLINIYKNFVDGVIAPYDMYFGLPKE